MKLFKYLFIIPLICTMSVNAMENSASSTNTQIIDDANITNKICNFQRWHDVITHIKRCTIENGKISGFHWYPKKKSIQVTKQQGKYTLTKINPFVWVIAIGHTIDLPHCGYIVIKNNQNQFIVLEHPKSFFGCNTAEESLIEQIRASNISIQSSKDVRTALKLKCITNGSTPLVIGATAHTNSPLFFINTVYPITAEEPVHYPDLLSCCQDIQQLDSQDRAQQISNPNINHTISNNNAEINELDKQLIDAINQIIKQKENTKQEENCSDENTLSIIQAIENLLLQGANPNSFYNRNAKSTLLMIASKYGLHEVVNLLLEYGANNTALDNDGNSAHFYAVNSGDYFTLLSLLGSSNTAGNIKNKHGVSLITQAVRNGQLEMIPLLLRSGADIDAQTNNGNTPLMECYELSKDSKKFTIAREIANYLIDEGASLELKNEKKKTVKELATGEFAQLIKDKEITRELKKQEQEKEKRAKEAQAARRALALQEQQKKEKEKKEQEAFLKELKDAIDANDLIKLDLSKVNKITQDHINASFCYAVKNEKQQAIKHFLEFLHPSISCTDRSKQTVLQLAYKSPEIFKLLAHNKSAPVDELAKLFGMALEKGDSQQAVILLESPHKVIFATFMYALKVNNSKQLKLLLKYADLLNSDDWLAIISCAIITDNENALALLEKCKENCALETILNQPDTQGKTILLIACEHNRPAIVKWLLTQEKINDAIKDTYGKNALDYCLQHKNQECLNLLLQQNERKKIQRSQSKLEEEPAKKTKKEINEEFIAAIDSGNFEKVQACWQQGANLNYCPKNGFCALFHAIKKPNEMAPEDKEQTNKIVEFLLSKEINITVTEKKHDDNPLIYAVTNNNLGIVKMLLDKDSSHKQLFHQNKNGDTALMVACAKGFYDIANYLVNKNGTSAHINHSNDIGNTALIEACKKGNQAIAKLLITHNAIINHTNHFGNSALCAATSNGHLELVKYLVEQHADYHVINTDGDNLLSIAATNGSIELVKYVVTLGLDINHDNGYEYAPTPLFLAAESDHPEAFEYLIQMGADIIVRNKLGKTIKEGFPYPKIVEILDRQNTLNEQYQSAVLANNVENVKQCLEKGAQPLSSIQSHHSLYVAIFKGCIKTAKYLLKHINFNTAMLSDCLVVSCSKNDEDLPELLIEKGAPINHEHQDTTALFGAAYNGNLKRVKALVEQGAQINYASSKSKTTALIEAIKGKKNLETITYLINNGADIDYANKEGETPLQLAIVVEQPLIAKALLNSGANMHQKVGNQTLLEIVEKQQNKEMALVFNEFKNDQELIIDYARMGNCQAIKELIQNKGITYVKYQNKDNYSAIEYAAQKNNLPIIQLLMKIGADKSRALAEAVNTNNLTCVQYLLDHGADPNTTPFKLTPLAIAIDKKYLDIAELLIKYHANIDSQESQEVRYTALDFACMGKCTERAQFLLKNGANPNLRNRYGQTSLHHAAFVGSLELVKILISNGANVYLKTIKSETPLDIAKHTGKTEVEQFLQTYIEENEKLMSAAKSCNIKQIETLLKNSNCASLQYQSEDEHVTPFSLAAMYNKKEAVEFFINHANSKKILHRIINTPDSNGNTPLMIAALNGCTKVSELLLQHGANPSAKNRFKDSAASLCIREKQHALITLLAGYNADLSITDLENNSLLMRAIKEAKVLCAHTLLDALKIDNPMHHKIVNTRNTQGQTALTLALAMGYHDLVEKLQHFTANANTTNTGLKSDKLE